MDALSTAHFSCAPDPENPGWMTWEIRDVRRFNAVALGKLIVRKESVSSIRMRMFPGIGQSNLSDKVHGGAIMSVMDVALFAAARILLGVDPGGGVTLEMSAHFMGSGALFQPLDVVVDVLRETGRLVFLRGLTIQGDHTIGMFSGTIRKLSRPS